MKLIVAFPGTGKTYAEAYLKLKGIPSIDYDSKEVNKEEGWEEKYVENIVEFIRFLLRILLSSISSERKKEYSIILF